MRNQSEDKFNNRTESNDSRQTRRDVLRSIGATAGILIGSGTAIDEVSAETVPTTPETFRVQGQEIITTYITPDEIQIKRRRVSPDLKERYGQAALVTTETHPRPEDHDNDLPQRDTRTIRQEWDTYYAKKDEWTEYLTERDKIASEISTMALDRPDDCPMWYHENVDGGFERKGPMNLVGITMNGEIDGLITVLQEEGGWSSIVVQYNRFAWVPQNSQFEMQHRSAATSSLRLLGGYHAKFWKTGNYITTTAHEDNEVKHEAISFNTAEFEMVDIFNQYSESNAIKNRYNFNNNGYLDHGGYVSHIYSSEP